MIDIIQGDCLASLPTLPRKKFRCCVTSPPYYGLRDYNHAGQIGLEETPQHYIDKIVAVFAAVREVLTDDGTLWLNLGDSYAGSLGAQSRGDDYPGNLGGSSMLSARQIAEHPKRTGTGSLKRTPGLKSKDLMGIPWRVAFALQSDGWYLRSDIIWAKPNCMPESVTDRPTRSHEYIFLLAKSERYFYDHEAIKEPASLVSAGQDKFDNQTAFDTDHVANGYPSNLPERTTDKQRGHSRRHEGFNDRWDKMSKEIQCGGTRNKRDVWTVAPANYADAHFATFPRELIQPCILAGAAQGDFVIDPFGGSGTTGEVALSLGRRCTLLELNPDYCALARRRCTTTVGLGI